jgi:aminoglycoside phosphotransferase (APT) family kinase protein
MRLNTTSQYAALIEHALEKIIEPEVQTPEAKESIDLIRLTLRELCKREGPAKDVLRRYLKDGKVLYSEISGQLDNHEPNGIEPSSGDLEAQGFDELAQAWDALNRKVAVAADQLATSSKLSQGQIDMYLRKAAEWEWGYFHEIEGLELEATNRPVVPPSTIRTITKGFLEAFLNSIRGPLTVVSLAPVAGGYSNQTFLCTVEHDDGRVEHLAVRKSNPRVVAPFLDLDQEFILLGVLEQAGYPVPRPIDLGHQVEGIDDTFYTMEKLPGRIPGSFFGHETSKVPSRVLLRLADLLAQLHQIPLDKFDPFIKARHAEAVLHETVEDCYRRNLCNLREYSEQVEHLPSPYLTWILNWLEHNIPKDTRPVVLTHGDFNIHNVLADSNDQVTGVLDWECADFGAPEQDLAYMQSHVSQHMKWDDFIQQYRASGGREPDPHCMIFTYGYTMLRIALALLRKNWDVQNHNTDDLRFVLLQFRFTHGMFKLGLDGIPAPGKIVSNEEP